MRKSLLVLLSLSMSYCLMAQEPAKQQEAGLTFYNLNGFGLTYRTGTEQSLWRFNTLAISGGNTDNSTSSAVNKQTNASVTIKVGKEYREKLVDKLELRYGADVSLGYRHSKLEVETTSTNYYRSINRTAFEPGVNMVIGLNYMINENLVIGAELLPAFNYSLGTTKEKETNVNNGNEVKTDNSGYNYGLSNGSALLSIAFRF
ncbi:hypothetical protein [uncultured Roseivirga sp.]|uniref:hypothetical protein n=1 Tax=uncultured Roseivirga sp. TaxID=543088 RepID=UPI0030D7F672